MDANQGRLDTESSEQGLAPRPPGGGPGWRAADQAYESLRSQVISGTLPAGMRLTESMLADSLGLSRTPVREAIRRLLMEGFLSRLRGEGLRVVGFSTDEIAQIFEIRLMLESYAARRAALHATEADIAELRRLAAHMSARTPPATEQAARELSEANARFHRRLVDAAASPRLRVMLSGAVDAALVIRTYRMYSERDLLRSTQHHQELVDAIAARAPDWAASVMAAHLQAAANVAIHPDAPNGPGGDAAPSEAPPR
jgi:DNA-binding GntR family transcriptional regulator